jgi:type II restriction enzyme
VRAGWVAISCSTEIPPDGRIAVVAEGKLIVASLVRRAYDRLRPLEKVKGEKRGWTLDVLQVVRSLNKTQFTIADMYGRAGELTNLHPDNRHVRDKIRQQLQVLRDMGLPEFLGGGRYRLR